jgi:Glutamine synthetase, catalytic domain
MRWFFASSARHAITANTVSAGRLPRVIALLQDVHLRKPADGSTSGPRCLPRRRAWPKSSRGGRIPGADVNPYLAAAAMIAAGLHGVDNELPLEATFDGNAYTAAADRVPTTLRDAAELWRNSALARKAFGDEVVAHYTNAARMEIAALDSAVTDWENPATSSAFKNGGSEPHRHPDRGGSAHLAGRRRSASASAEPSHAGSMTVRWPRLRNAFCSATRLGSS